VFGDSICGAEVNQGILLTLHKKQMIKAYSLSSIQQVKLFKKNFNICILMYADWLFILTIKGQSSLTLVCDQLQSYS